MAPTFTADGDTAPGLALNRYRQPIGLDEPFRFESHGSLCVADRDAIVARTLDHLIQRERLIAIDRFPPDYDSRRRLLRGLLNIRPPKPLDGAFLQDLNALLHDENAQRGPVAGELLATVADTMPAIAVAHADRLAVWKGDISALRVDAIVNAANDRLLGCFQPLHECIDNVIHSAAGPMLRQDCQTIMRTQQHREQTGDAKITRAYHLPSTFVLHTVGPIIGPEPPSRVQQVQLASCYRNCLALADQLTAIKTIALPCIATGVFNFPRHTAAQIAVSAVQQWLGTHAHHFERVVFNVFLQEDFDCYDRVFQRRIDR